MNALLRQIVAGAAFTLFHQASVAQLVMCGLGPPPGAPEYQTWTSKTEQQRKHLGYLLVCDELLERYRFESQATDDKTVRRGLVFKPLSLDTSLFSKLKPIGSIADGFGDHGATMYRRVFLGIDGEVITLLQSSLQNGADVGRVRDDGTVRIRNVNAQLTFVQSVSGQGFAQLAWKENSTYFEVTASRGVDNGRTKDRLIALAESIPKTR